MRIAVLGATGWIGGSIAREAISRGHEVTAIARDRERLAELGVDVAIADATDPQSVAEAIAGHDIAIAAVTDRSTADRSVIPAAARALIEAAPLAGVQRVAWMGGGGSLAAPEGGRFVDQPGFPEQYKAEALAQAAALELFRGAPADLDWIYLSPPPHNLVPGESRGGYRTQAGDEPVLDAEGHDEITSGDLAAAMIDVVEEHRYSRQRFTCGY